MLQHSPEREGFSERGKLKKTLIPCKTHGADLQGKTKRREKYIYA